MKNKFNAEKFGFLALILISIFSIGCEWSVSNPHKIGDGDSKLHDNDHGDSGNSECKPWLKGEFNHPVPGGEELSYNLGGIPFPVSSSICLKKPKVCLSDSSRAECLGPPDREFGGTVDAKVDIKFHDELNVSHVVFITPQNIIKESSFKYVENKLSELETPMTCKGDVSIYEIQFENAYKLTLASVSGRCLSDDHGVNLKRDINCFAYIDKSLRESGIDPISEGLFFQDIDLGCKLGTEWILAEGF